MTRPRLLDVLLAELDANPEGIGELVELLAPRLTGRLVPAEPEPDRWFDAKAAAAYLALPLNTLHKHTAARTIPFHQDGPGCKCWFLRSELDAWRRGQRGPIAAVSPGPRFQNASNTASSQSNVRRPANKNPARAGLS